MFVFENETVHFWRVSRRHMGVYLCIASNGIPPSISKRIILQVTFQPSLRVSNQLVGVPIRADVKLECNIEASPRAINFWRKENGDMLMTNGKYEVIENEYQYKTTLQLKIFKLKQADFGTYVCSSKNSHGEAEGSIQLYELPQAISKAELDYELERDNQQSHTPQIMQDGFQTLPLNDSTVGLRYKSKASSAQSRYNNFPWWNDIIYIFISTLLPTSIARIA